MPSNEDTQNAAAAAAVPATVKPPWRALAWVAAVPAAILLMVGAGHIAVMTAWLGIEEQRASGLSAVAGPVFWDKTASDLLDRSEPDLARAAILVVQTPEFDRARARLEALITENGGFFVKVRLAEPERRARAFEATAHLPADRLDGVTEAVKQVGRVRHASAAAEETAAQATRLSAQLENLRVREERLRQLVRRRSGSMAELLAAEKEIAAVRKEVEQHEEQYNRLGARVRYAALEVSLREEYRARFGWRESASLLALRNAAVDGAGNLLASFAWVAGFVLHYGLVLAFWALLLFYPARRLRRRWRPAAQ